jgi:hypothetical protein
MVKEGVDCGHSTEDRDRWLAVLTTGMTLGFRETRRIAGLSEDGALPQADHSACSVDTGLCTDVVVFQTFCVVSKRFRKNYIHRFTATKSFFLFSPWNAVRRTCIFLSTNQYFDYVVMTTILLNCVFLAKTESVEETE